MNSVYNKNTFNEPCANYFSYTSYIIVLIHTFVDREGKIDSKLYGFYDVIKRPSYTLERNLFPEHLTTIIIILYFNRIIQSAKIKLLSREAITQYNSFWGFPILHKILHVLI